jgi:hypothetical protein
LLYLDTSHRLLCRSPQPLSCRHRLSIDSIYKLSAALSSQSPSQFPRRRSSSHQTLPCDSPLKPVWHWDLSSSMRSGRSLVRNYALRVYPRPFPFLTTRLMVAVAPCRHNWHVDLATIAATARPHTPPYRSIVDTTPSSRILRSCMHLLTRTGTLQCAGNPSPITRYRHTKPASPGSSLIEWNASLPTDDHMAEKHSPVCLTDVPAPPGWELLVVQGPAELAKAA